MSVFPCLVVAIIINPESIQQDKNNNLKQVKIQIRTPQKIAEISPKFEQGGHRIMHPKSADRIANSVDPDQTAPSGQITVVCLNFAEDHSW